MRKILPIFFLLVLRLIFCPVLGQSKKDNIKIKQQKEVDTTIKKGDFNPRIATKRSAIIPGWGQIYNKKYWKLPLVYGALGTTGYIFFYNIKTYKLLRQAYSYKVDPLQTNIGLIDPRFKNFSAEALKINRNAYRQNVDYSVVFFIIFWGLNVVDATVDAQLKGFNVNDNLSLRFNPGYSPLANTNGLSLILDLHQKKGGQAGLFSNSR